MSERQLTVPVPCCIHLQSLIEALKPLSVDLCDGYSDWFTCREHDNGIRLDIDGNIVGYSLGHQDWVYRDWDGQGWVKL